jgi:hypothetical protein
MNRAKARGFQLPVIIFLCMVAAVFAVRTVVAALGADWYDGRLYLLRVVSSLAVDGLSLSICAIIIRKKLNVSWFRKGNLNAYRITEYIIACIFLAAEIFETFRSNWMESESHGVSSYLLAGLFFITIPCLFEQLRLHPEEKGKKRNYVVFAVVVLLGMAALAYGIINWMVAFGMIEPATAK